MWIRQTHQCNIFGNSWCNDGFQQNVILQSINHWGEGGGCSWCWVSTRALVIVSTTSSYICMYLCVCICIGPYCILYLHICICTWKRCRLLVLMGAQVQVQVHGSGCVPGKARNHHSESERRPARWSEPPQLGNLDMHSDNLDAVLWWWRAWRGNIDWRSQRSEQRIMGGTYEEGHMLTFKIILLVILGSAGNKQTK